MADKQDNLAGHGFEQRVGEGSRDASEPPVGVKERCPGIKAYSHPRHQEPARKRRISPLFGSRLE